MGSSEPESEGELGEEVGLAMRAQLVLSLKLFHSLLPPSSRDSLILLLFLPLE